jgi:hypothetical protein
MLGFLLKLSGASYHCAAEGGFKDGFVYVNLQQKMFVSSAQLPKKCPLLQSAYAA